MVAGQHNDDSKHLKAIPRPDTTGQTRTHKVLLRAAGAADESMDAHSLPRAEEVAVQHQRRAHSTAPIRRLCNMGRLGVAELQREHFGLAVQAVIGHHHIRFLGPLCLPAS